MQLENILTVSELTKQIKLSLEEEFSQVSVVGELSNFKAHVSGHWYFSLKDGDAVINCTMWKGFNNYVFFTPEDGIRVIVNGKITVYPPRGSYQIDVRSMKPAGMGELQAAYERLKQKLADEGLFDAEYKKEIPLFPGKIGIVTAIDGAAFRDMLSVAKRRYPLSEIVIAPSKVQGSGAAQSVVGSIKQLNKQSDIDVIIVGRGGGSIEDLWAFNEEIVARAIFNSEIPVITGIGHEVDFTIADFVADLRAPTPSVAMEMATPDQNEIIGFINEFNMEALEIITERFIESRKRVNSVLNSYGFRVPLDIVRNRSQQVDNLLFRVLNNIDRKILIAGSKLELLSKSLEAHNIEKVLKKGFVLVRQDSQFITRKKKFLADQLASLEFHDGKINVKKIDKG